MQLNTSWEAEESLTKHRVRDFLRDHLKVELEVEEGPFENNFKITVKVLLQAKGEFKQEVIASDSVSFRVS